MIKRPLVRCGNSIGVNIPPALLELVGVTVGDEAEIRVDGDRLVIVLVRPRRRPGSVGPL